MRGAAALLVSILVAGCARPLPRRQQFTPGLPPPGWVVPVPAPAVIGPTLERPVGIYRGFGVESVPPEVLARHAPPAASATDEHRIRALFDIRSPRPGILTDRGKTLWFSWAITGTPQLYRMRGPDSFPEQWSGGEDSTELAGVVDDGRLIVVSRRGPGESDAGLYLLDPKSGDFRTILHEPKVDAVLDFVRPDASALYFRANDVEATSYALYRYDLATHTSTRVFADPGYWAVLDERGSRLLLEKSVGPKQEEIFELDTTSKVLTPLVGQGRAQAHHAAYGAGEDVLVLGWGDGNFRRIFRLEGAKLAPVSPELGRDVVAFTIDPAKKTIFYSVVDEGRTHLRALDGQSKKPLDLRGAPSAEHVLLGAVSGDRLTLAVDRGFGPPETGVLDRKSGKLTPWHRRSVPELDPTRFVKATIETFPSRDGSKIPAIVRVPVGCAAPGRTGPPCPVVVVVHGGPGSQAKPGWSPAAQLFTDEGFIVVEPNIRGSDGYGRAYLAADDGAKRAAAHLDIEDVANHVRERFAVYGTRPKVGVFGVGYGGTCALIGMTRFAGGFDAGVSISGSPSLVSYMASFAPFRRVFRVPEFGDPETDRASLEAASPVTYVDRATGPVLMLAGVVDPRVPVGEAITMFRALATKSSASELLLFPEEGQGLERLSNRVAGMAAVLRFFRQHLAARS